MFSQGGGWDFASHVRKWSFFLGEKDQSERNAMYAHLDVLSARSKAVKRRVIWGFCHKGNMAHRCQINRINRGGIFESRKRAEMSFRDFPRECEPRVVEQCLFLHARED